MSSMYVNADASEVPYDALMNSPNPTRGNVENIEEGQIETADEPEGKWFSFRTLWGYTGPGWLMSIAYLDPGNLESDLQAGAETGYQLIWVLFWSTILGLILQCLAARLGTVTGKNLAQMCRDEYPRSVSLVLWVMTELAIIGSDIQEVVGSAIAMNILFGWPLYVGTLVTGLDTFTFLLIHYFGVRKLEAVFAFLIFAMCTCFFVNFGEVNPPANEIMKGFVPEIAEYGVVQGISIVGAVIMPHNIYLHSALVQSRKVDRTDIRKVKEANKYFSIEAALALFVSFLINLAVVAVFANQFFDDGTVHGFQCAQDGNAYIPGINGQTAADPCGPIGLRNAGAALYKTLGESAKYVWAIGLLAAGQSSTMTGTFAGQYVMEGFLDLKIAIWKRVAITRAIALVPAVLVAVLASNELEDTLSEWLNVLQSVQLPFALIPVLHFTSRRSIMGQFKNGAAMQVFGWLVSLGIIVINIYLVVQQLLQANKTSPFSAGGYVLIAVLSVFYFGFITLLLKEDFLRGLRYFRNRKSSIQV